MHDNINHRNRIAEPPYHLPHLCWWVTVFTISWCCSCGCKQATHDARATIFSFPKSTNRWCLSLGHTLAAALVFLNSRPDGLWIEWRYALLTSLTNKQNQNHVHETPIIAAHMLGIKNSAQTFLCDIDEKILSAQWSQWFGSLYPWKNDLGHWWLRLIWTLSQCMSS